MKKALQLAVSALTALLLMPASAMAQDCEFTPDMFPGQAADRTALEVNATVQVGEFAKCPNTLGLVGNLTTTDASVVQVYCQGGYEAVLTVGAGTATVTYTEERFTTTGGNAGGAAGGGGAEGGGGDAGGGTSNVCQTNHIIHYTVNKGTPTARFVYGREEVTEYHASYPGGFSGPSPEVIIQEVYYQSNVYPAFRDKYIDPMSEMMLTSSNPSVASIGRGNSVTLMGLGETTITATWAGNTNWEAVEISYKLIVEAPKQTAYISFSPTMQYTDTIGHTMNVQPMIRPDGAQIAISRWTSSNPAVATVDDQGTVTMLSAGTTQIMAIFDGDDTYYAAQGYYFLTVVKRDPKMSFTPNELTVELGVPWERPVLNNPYNLTVDKWYCGDYESNALIEVNEATGEVTLKAAGTATVACECFGNTEFNSVIVSYTLHITTSGVTICGIPVTSLNSDDVMNDGQGSVSFGETSTYRTVTLTHAVLDAGGATVAIEDTKGGVPLRVKMNGNCEINNVQTAIKSDAAILMWGENKKDTLVINATHAAIEAPFVKIHDSYIFATGVDYGINCTTELGISAGGYVFATATGENGEAIHLHPMSGNFVKGEGGIGGIQVLTRGVYYNGPEDQGPNGFYPTDPYDKNPVKFVEIGKVPLPVATDEVTEIDFTEDNPDENLDVVFSASEGDTFNEADKQLEITTTTTDQQITDALELYVTCSSEWLKLLPGVLVFDVPAGSGKFEIQCQIAEGFRMQTMIEGVGSTQITQTKPGWIEVAYNVLEQTHVIVYLQAESPSPAPKRIAAAHKDAAPAATIKAIKITPQGAASAIDLLPTTEAENGKMLHNGQLYILRDGHLYTATGVEVR